jgi:hypothetical protein
VAYAVANGWLVAASHLGAFEGLLPAIPHGSALTRSAVAGAGLTLEAPAFSQTMSKFLAAVSLVYMGSGTPEAEQTRARLADWRGILQTLAPLGRVEVTARPGPAGAELILSASADLTPPP